MVVAVGRRDDDGVGRAAQLDVGDAMFGRHGRVRRDDEALGERLEGHRSDELLGAPRERHVHVRTGLRERAGQLRRLVGGDAAGDAEDDPRARQHAHGPFHHLANAGQALEREVGVHALESTDVLGQPGRQTAGGDDPAMVRRARP